MHARKPPSDRALYCPQPDVALARSGSSVLALDPQRYSSRITARKRSDGKVYDRLQGLFEGVICLEQRRELLERFEDLGRYVEFRHGTPSKREPGKDATGLRQ